MLHLPQFQDIDVIYDGQRTIVYRAIHQADQHPVIVKALRDPHPHFNELVEFRNQYVATRNLDSPHPVLPIALEDYENGYALVMPDEGAMPLEEYWRERFDCKPGQDKGADKLRKFLQVAVQLTSALQYLGS